MIPAATLARCARVWWEHHRGRRTPPLSVTWFVNEVCNLRCRGCFFFDHPHEGPGHERELDSDEALALVDEIAALGVPFLELVGGEPFLRRDLLELAARARERGLWCGVTTNGTRLDASTAARAREAFRTVFVSIDGFEAAHEAVRGPGTFARAWSGLDHLLAARGDALVGVSTIVTPENVDDLVPFAEHLGAHGVAQLVLSSGLAPSPSPPLERGRAAVEALLALRSRAPGFLPQDDAFFRALVRFWEAGERYGCAVDRLLHVAVTPSGGSSACCMWPVPLAAGRRVPLARALCETRAADFAPVGDCSGCVRFDYAWTGELLAKPMPALAAATLGVALGSTFRRRS